MHKHFKIKVIERRGALKYLSVVFVYGICFCSLAGLYDTYFLIVDLYLNMQKGHVFLDRSEYPSIVF